MAKNNKKAEHADAMELIGYGLAKFAGSQKGKNEIANYLAKNKKADCNYSVVCPRRGTLLERIPCNFGKPVVFLSLSGREIPSAE